LLVYFVKPWGLKSKPRRRRLMNMVGEGPDPQDAQEDSNENKDRVGGERGDILPQDSQ
jgi:hypothetical protein